MTGLERTHLEIVRAVEKHSTITAAAKSLNVTQSALSHGMRKLEETLNVKIWRRQGRTMKFTQAGEYLLAVANRLLPQLKHVEERLSQFESGSRGTLRIGMECHPCYQWLLTVAQPFLENWPKVDLDVKQKFQFGGMAALFGYEIDVLVTPDPLFKKDLVFTPVFSYEQVLVVGTAHPMFGASTVEPKQLSSEVVLTYPVNVERLDIFSHFLTPAGILPKEHRTTETTDIMLQMVASGRAVTALPRWLVEANTQRFKIGAVRLGKTGIFKQIFLGIRKADIDIDYISAFIEMAKQCTKDRISE